MSTSIVNAEQPALSSSRGSGGAQFSVRAGSGRCYVVLTGNPNSGKTTVFNGLTGLRAKVGNYAGVTVERKEGRLLEAGGVQVQVLDLPGTYSLAPQSLDEQIARDVLFHRLPELPAPSAVVVVVDASNLRRNLYYATQVIELGYPTVVALNMIDIAERHGQHVDPVALARELGVPVVPLVASERQGIGELRKHILNLLAGVYETQPRRFCQLPPAFEQEVEALTASLTREVGTTMPARFSEAMLLIGEQKPLETERPRPPELEQRIAEARQRLAAAGLDSGAAGVEARYRTVSELLQKVSRETRPPGETLSDKIDRVATHKLWGTLIFMGLMLLMFQGIFTLATPPMDWIESGVEWLGARVGGLIPPGDLNSLVVDGIIGGVGAVIVFLPQILLLFLFIGLLEDTGYMARAAFLMDRLMSKVGLHGKSFIPMLSSFACAIPGIMATRTIESPKDRLVTILIAPLMSCSARLPVYTLLIAATIPDIKVLGIVKLAALTMLSMYLLGVVVALLMAWVFKKTLLRGDTPLLIIELPSYKRPKLRLALRQMWERSGIFLKQAGTIILGLNIILWFLTTYPRTHSESASFEAKRAQIQAQAAGNPTQEHERLLQELDEQDAGARLRNSFAGRLGRAIEPMIAPLGFDWKIGVGIVTSFAAREVFVSTVSTIYNLSDGSDPQSEGLIQTLREQERPDGRPMYTALTGITLMVFYVFALQCASTVAVVKRETNSWRWPIFQWLYLGALAWIFAFLTWRVGLLLGFN